MNAIAPPPPWPGHSRETNVQPEHDRIRRPKGGEKIDGSREYPEKAGEKHDEGKKDRRAQLRPEEPIDTIRSVERNSGVGNDRSPDSIPRSCWPCGWRRIAYSVAHHNGRPAYDWQGPFIDR